MKYRLGRVPLFILSVLILSLAVRLLVFNAFMEKGAIESYEYDEIAKNMLAGRGYSFDYMGLQYKSYGSPLYPFLIYSIYMFNGIETAPVVYFQIALSFLSCFAVFFIARRLGGEMLACLAFMLCAFHPALIIYSVKKIHALSLDTLLFLLSILSVMSLRESFSFGRACLSGFIIGLAALSRPTILIFLPVTALWVLFASRRRFSEKGLRILVLASVAAIAVLSWTIRNYIVHREIVISSTCDTLVFWRGNNPNATGASFRTDKTTVLESDEELYKKVRELNEIERRRLFGEEALKFIRNQPFSFLKLYVRKLYYFWWFSPVSGLLYPGHYLVLYKLFYSVMLVFALPGFLILLTKRVDAARREARLLLLLLVSLSLSQSFFYVEGRHRWSVEPVLMVFSAAGILAVTKKISARTNTEV